MSNYFAEQKNVEIRIVDSQSSYITDNTVSNEGTYDIFTNSLPVFSQVNKMINELEENEQTKFLIDITDCIKERIQEANNNRIFIYNIPNIEANIDQDNAIILVWQFPSFRVFFDIEKSIEGSFYGYIGKGGNGGSFSKTELLSRDNYSECIDSIMNNILQIL